MKIYQSIAGLCLAALLSACGGGGDGAASTAVPTSGATASTGIFVDSPVSGISYTTATQSGKTSVKGEFLYLPGENVTFSIGSIQLPAVLASAMVTPLDIAQSPDINHQVVSNILVLLQSLDEDGNPANGISIPVAAATKATTPVNFDVSPAAFSANVAVTALVANSGSVTKMLVAAATAKAHFQSTLNALNGYATAGNGSSAETSAQIPTFVDDLTAVAGTAVSMSSSTLCGYEVGGKTLQGTVSAVHDGDTITLNSAGIVYKIRLDTIDAPELAQPFGSASKSSLTNAVLGKTVRVAYSKTDKYSRVVGAVFTDSCEYVNLNQVATGMAWFYKAYQCEVNSAIRGQFGRAENAAVAAQNGLWSQANPIAPWEYRNGVDPIAPTCSDISAPLPANPIPTPTPVTSTYTPINGCFKVWVNAYTRSNGTRVSGYWRNSPGCN